MEEPSPPARREARAREAPDPDATAVIVGRRPVGRGGVAVKTSPKGRLGRYVVLEEIGRGGMGRVLRAYDPKLQREVALKEVQHRHDWLDAWQADWTRRLVSEARAMAMLSHPNVVAVYDVEEVPGAEGEMVLVMEYVAGPTLRAWLRAQRRDWRAIVRAFVQAGRGLAAAHAAGLLHRDFKPSNALVASGTVKVTDFGLAKPSGAAASGDGALPVSEEHGHSGGAVARSSGSLTQTGVVLGTPRYMAPEQYVKAAGELTTAIDQYAFCVALWEALCGCAPFQGTDIEAEKGRGPPPWPAGGEDGEDVERSAPASEATPRPIVDALRRGLAPDPGDRWPSMDALLGALAYDPARRRARFIGGVGALTAVALASGGWQAWTSARVQRCSVAAAQDRLASAWGEARRRGVQAAVLGVGTSYAARAWESTAAALDAYAAHWTALHVQACEATMRGEQPAEVMDLRMGCLHRAGVDVQAVTAVLADADAEVVSRAHELVGGLRPLSRCSDVAALRAEVEPPLPAEADAVETIRAHVAAARAAGDAARYDEARTELDTARTVLADVRYGPVHTEVALAEGIAVERDGDYAGAEAAYRAAWSSAARFRQWREMEEAASRLFEVVGWKQKRFAEGLRYKDVAQGLAKRDPDLEAGLSANLTLAFYVQGRFDEAATAARRTIDLYIEALGAEHPEVATAHHNLANVLHGRGEFDEAEAEYRRALEQRERLLGAGHPDVAATRHNLASALHGQGKYAEAEAENRRTLAAWQEILGPAHPDVATSHNNLGNALTAQGRYVEAEAELRRALALRIDALGAEHPEVAVTRDNLGNALAGQGRFADAEHELRRALGSKVDTLGADHREVAVSRGSLAATLAGQGKYEEAEVHFRKGLEMQTRALGPDHPAVALARSDLGNVLLAERRYAEAVTQHREALAIRTRALGADHPEVAGSRGSLATALAGAGELDEAEAQARLAIAGATQALGPDHPWVASARDGLAEILDRRGHAVQAEAEWTRALATLEAAHGVDNPELALIRAKLARATLARGDVDGALRRAEHAWATLASAATPSDVRAAVAFVLARGLWTRGDAGGRRRALALAQEAAGLFDAAGPQWAKEAATVQAWLDGRGVGPARAELGPGVAG